MINKEDKRKGVQCVNFQIYSSDLEDQICKLQAEGKQRRRSHCKLTVRNANACNCENYRENYREKMQDNRVHVTPTNVVVQTREYDKRPFDWTVPAFCVCCCCCWPLGVIAMVYANDANTAADHGDFEHAHKRATIAGVLTVASFLCGVGAIVAIVVIVRTQMI